ncbi:MAG: hypothetical protein IT204_11135 [Fimbriimonadaceae bacterium]|nr:hypothetical protein [Fimbriimonadaceae bacterium]
MPALAMALLAVSATTAPEAAGTALELPARWQYSAPLVTPVDRPQDRSVAQKDPTVVFHDGRWHLFMTIKAPGLTAIESCSFARWEDADAAPRSILRVTASRYYAAPQVFFFRPQQLWYLVYQVGLPGLNKMWVAYSTTRDLSDPSSWTPARPILDGGPADPRREGGLDYWVICDAARAYLFFTSLNGKLWRSSTRLEEFPTGFGPCQVALRGPFFEASHTYAVKGTGRYLTLIEQDGRRYYQAYLADRLDGEWTALANTPERPFASWQNIAPAAGVTPWTDHVSHGELLRDGCDETLTVDPAHWQFLFQGLLERDKAGQSYGQLRWRLGLLSPGPSDDTAGRWAGAASEEPR